MTLIGKMGPHLVTVAALLAASLVACSGKYREGDDMSDMLAEPDPMTGAIAGSSGVGQGSAGSNGSTVDDPTSPERERAEVCEPMSEPPAVAGPFAAPAIVWSRLSQLIHGEQRDPPSPLPTETTVLWAQTVAWEAYEAELVDDGKVEGIQRFLEGWAELPAEPLEVDWAAVASQPDATFRILVETPQPDDRERLGLFNDRVWLSAHPFISNRARVVFSALLYQSIPAPPAGIELVSPDLGGTRRQNLTAAVAEAACKACHDVLDPLGLALEHFDELGAYRTIERGQQVDASGSLQHGLIWSDDMAFDSWTDLAPRLAASCDVGVGFALSYYKYALSLMDREPSSDIDWGTWEDNLEEQDARRVVQRFMISGGLIPSLPASLAQTEGYLR
jgi:hypothetical protein